MDERGAVEGSERKGEQMSRRFVADPFFMKGFAEACEQRVCPLCHLRDSQTLKRLDMLLWECVTDPGVRNQIIACRGFCHRHARLLLFVAQKQGAAMGVAMIYEHLLRELLPQLQRCSPSSGLPRKRTKAIAPSSGLVSSSSPADSCYACVGERERASSDLRAFLDSLSDPRTGEEVRTLYEKSAGLCLPHYEQAIAICSDKEVKRYLTDKLTDQLESLRWELAEFIRKHDYNVREKSWGAESDSWQRVVRKCTGEDMIR